MTREELLDKDEFRQLFSVYCIIKETTGEARSNKGKKSCTANISNAY